MVATLLVAVIAASFVTPSSAASALSSTTGHTVENAAGHTIDLSDDMVVVPEVAAEESEHAHARSASAGSTATRSAATQPAAKKSVEKIWVSSVRVTSTTKDDVNTRLDEKARITAFVAKLNSYWSKETDGAVTIELGGYERRSLGEDSCNAASLMSDLPDIAFGGAFDNSDWIGTHDHLLGLSYESCDQAGRATIGGDGGVIFSGNGIGSTYGLPVALHEFGHNLGFGHAGSSMCRSTTLEDAAVSSFGSATSKCPTDEYGDYLDIMGYSMSSAIPHLSTPQRIRSGYLDAFMSVTKATGTTTVTIAPLTTGSSKSQAVRVTDPRSGETYYIEYRTGTGADATSTEFTSDARCVTLRSGYVRCARGANETTGAVRILRELPYRNFDELTRTTVLAAGSTSSDMKRSTNLRSGDRFTSTGNGFYLRVNSLGGSKGASVTVSFTAPAASKTVVKLSTTKVTHGKKSAKLTATVAKVHGVVQKGTVAFMDGSKVIATRTVNTKGVATYTMSKSAAKGEHVIRARFLPAKASVAVSTSASKSVTVVAAKSSR